MVSDLLFAEPLSWGREGLFWQKMIRREERYLPFAFRNTRAEMSGSGLMR